VTPPKPQKKEIRILSWEMAFESLCDHAPKLAVNSSGIRSRSDLVAPGMLGHWA
jgi:hypothetical protein